MHIHWHHQDHVAGVNVYYECRCGHRRVFQPRYSGISPVDNTWLAGGPRVLEPKHSQPPKGPGGVSRPHLDHSSYETGYRNGESSLAADWDFALTDDDTLPEGIEAQPSQVKGYIQNLQAQALAVQGVLADAAAGDYASSGRDFGRGVAYLANAITEAIKEVAV